MMGSAFQLKIILAINATVLIYIMAHSVRKEKIALVMVSALN